ncbi:MAG: rhomboid family intramembrane serine protease [Akkermansiaceae bacterium]|nr:rhomboid family intramembrane serine protease [Akkermansiaceae bacterium]
MGLSDRDYHRVPPQQAYGQAPQRPSRLAGAPVVKWLLIINIAVFILDKMVNYSLTYYGHFSVGFVFEHGQVWRFITFQFLHSHQGIMHILFNMFGLFMFGHFVEKWWGSRKFLAFYLLSGCAGALMYSLLYSVGIFGKDVIDLGDGYTLSSAYIPLVGASAGLYACLIAVAVISPDLRVQLLFPPIPMKMKTFALGVLAIGVVVTFANLQNAGGEAGHLGGAILGFILMKKPRLLAWVPDGSVRKRRPTVDAKIIRDKKIRPKINISLDDSEIDRILDKVNREGLQSLTDDEREVLRRVAGQ